ncbi:MAG: type I DNA topoisomerase [bacterium]|nr:type I DNA topoisomerase [bacterium]
MAKSAPEHMKADASARPEAAGPAKGAAHRKTAAASKKSASPRKSAAPRKTASAARSARGGAGRSAARPMHKPDEGSADGKHLIIVESPAKARTIERYLGKDFKVVASVGHVIDLPATKLGVDVENDFKPEYVVIKGKKAILDAMRRQARQARSVYLAPDPDREGEAIAYHIAQWLKEVNPEVYRATFNEITKSAVQRAIQNPRAINPNLFNAQQARRVLDRLVGYKLSPLLWRKVRRGLSAGRVQSVAVRIICDREREIRLFQSQEYWTIEGQAQADVPPPFVIRLVKINDQKAEIGNQSAADAILDAVKGQPFAVGNIIRREVAKRPFAPFITSTLQQEASRKLRMPAARTMALAQRLYEGIELGEDGMVGLITYMRTDSTRLADEALGAIRGYIGESFGPDYLPGQARQYTTRKNAQDAHEAIRPTDIRLTPERVASFLEPPLLSLYTLIWRRAVACQMNDAKIERTRVEIPVAAGGAAYLFAANGSVTRFDGYLRVYQEAKDEAGKSESDAEGAEPLLLDEDEPLPRLEIGQRLDVTHLGGLQHFTQPPPRFTEAGLIKELEKQGIGRPSTYASIISVIQEKEYANKESGTFRPTDLGFIITDLLTESFPHIMDVRFTAMMEDQLDRVEDGTVDWVELLRNFYTPFAQRLEEAAATMRNIKSEIVPTEHVCDKCGSPMVVRWGRNGKFLACSAFPACRNTKPIVEDESGNITIAPQETTDKKCPACGADMIVKNGRRGRFLACSAYPECKTTMPYAIGVPCGRPGCDGELVERRSARGATFYSCNRYPDCRFSVFERPYREHCKVCNKAHFFIGEGEKKRVLCGEDKECQYAHAAVGEAGETK